MSTKETKTYNGLVLVNEEKVKRVMQYITRELEIAPTDSLIIAHYDKSAGLILDKGQPVPTGKFWDFIKNQPLKKDV